MRVGMKGTGTLLALTHIGSAVVLVLAGVAVISRSLALEDVRLRSSWPARC